MTDFSHLDAIENRIHNQTMRHLRACKMLEGKLSKREAAKWENEKAYRAREIALAEREAKAERKFLGLPELVEINLDDIFNELNA